MERIKVYYLEQKYNNTEPEFVNLLRSQGIDSQTGGIDSLESIPGLLKRLQIRVSVIMEW